MKRFIVLAAVSLALSQAHAAPLSRAEVAKLVSDAKGAVGKKLKDPASAHFQGLFLSEEQRESEGKMVSIYYVCGEVNAKNGYGGYVGYRRFASLSVASWVDNDEDSSAHDAFETIIWQRKCQNKVRDVK